MTIRTQLDSEDPERRATCTELARIRRFNRFHQQSQRLRQVTFSTVEVRSYPVILGFNPSVSRGPPITIDWDYFNKCFIPVQHFERTRPPTRSNWDMKIPSDYRHQLIISGGESESNIKLRLKEIQSLQRGGYYHEFLLEKLGRSFQKVKKSFLPKRKKKEESKEGREECYYA